MKNILNFIEEKKYKLINELEYLCDGYTTWENMNFDELYLNEGALSTHTINILYKQKIIDGYFRLINPKIFDRYLDRRLATLEVYNTITDVLINNPNLECKDLDEPYRFFLINMIDLYESLYKR